MKGLGFFQKVMFVINLFFSCVLLLACTIPYASSARLAFINLTVPFLFLHNDDFTVIDNTDPVGQLLGLLDVMRRQDDGNAGLSQ